MVQDFEKKRKRQKEKEKKKRLAQLKATDKNLIAQKEKMGRNRLILLFAIITFFAIVVFYNIR